ncbi:MAG: hypothetical protein JWQ91_2384 [Aeromicrobium sp.]|jgi:hypothetical protein|uniref:hypothetical protein n=1 Tax=Aeromicrobium sp. TaxID=1871063 RepID=UPI00262DBC1D|nr:hypothetical protein [Aeromicrobium sp.]MCW2789768.1 hypothetical protein [Aeromicrobium sp.]MCW2825467.1 hypothetical protein [Aeromicrobium sp.]
MATEERRPTKHFATLPTRVRLEDTITSQETEPAPDPEGGRDTERDFLIRYGFGL